MFYSQKISYLLSWQKKLTKKRTQKTQKCNKKKHETNFKFLIADLKSVLKIALETTHSQKRLFLKKKIGWHHRVWVGFILCTWCRKHLVSGVRSSSPTRYLCCGKYPSHALICLISIMTLCTSVHNSAFPCNFTRVTNWEGV